MPAAAAERTGVVDRRRKGAGKVTGPGEKALVAKPPVTTTPAAFLWTFVSGG
jgi:hypothetical protein